MECTFNTECRPRCRHFRYGPHAVALNTPYWSSLPFLISDIRALWRSVLSATAPECQKLTSLPKVIWEEGRVAAKVSLNWLQWRAPNSPQKVPLPVDRSPNPTTCLIPGPVRPMTPNGIRIRSAVFPQCTGQTDRPTDRQIVHAKV